MAPDLSAASTFLSGSARLLDRRRFEWLVGRGDAEGVLAALAAYGNADGGYGWGLEPDLRSGESQPAAAMHALEVFAETAPVVPVAATRLCDWLASVSLQDGGLPLALPVGDPAACAPWWTQADPLQSSLQITAAVAAQAHRVARFDAAVRDHPWLVAATQFCMDAIRALDAAPHAYELSFALQFLDAAGEADPEAWALLDDVGTWLPADGTLPVAGGIEGERLRPLDYAPDPDRPVRRLLRAEVSRRELDRLEEQQQADGGWPVDWSAASPAAGLEWRGYVTVRAVKVLAANSRSPQRAGCGGHRSPA